MAKLKIKVELKPKRCEVCHQIDMFDQERELCLRCIKINPDITENNFSNFVGKGKLHLISTSINSVHLAVFALIITVIAHLPLLCCATVAPPFYSGVTFFLVEAFITCFTSRWEKGIAKGVFTGIVLSIIVFMILLSFNPFNPIVSHYVSKN